MKLVKKPAIKHTDAVCLHCGAEYKVNVYDMRKVSFWYSQGIGYIKCKCCKNEKVAVKNNECN